MRAISSLHPTEGVPVPPDTTITLLLTGGSSAQASDWFSTGSTAGAASARAAGVGLIRVTPLTTAGGAFIVTVNMYSSGAVAMSSGVRVSSTSVGVACAAPTWLQVPGGSTGFSVAAITSGYVQIDCWAK